MSGAFRDKYVYRLFPEDVWAGLAGAVWVPYGAHDEADGFFHLSAGAQVLETARLHYGVHERLVAAGAPEAAFGAALKWEPSRGGQMFPHVYGDVPKSAFIHELRLERAEDGVFAIAPEPL